MIIIHILGYKGEFFGFVLLLFYGGMGVTENGSVWNGQKWPYPKFYSMAEWGVTENGSVWNGQKWPYPKILIIMNYLPGPYWQITSS